MTAGTAATSAAPSLLHATNPNLPFQPRRLTRSERNRREVFVYFSPRNQRIVTISEALHAALAMQFEFDSTLVAYVERPRRIQLTSKQQIDLSFWTRSKAGEERFHLAIPDCGTMGSTSGTVSIRDRAALDDAAQRHGIQLHYPTERELLSARTWLVTGFELLPLVWWYGRLASRSLIRSQIRARLTNAPRVNLSSLIQTLEFAPVHIRTVVAAMVHDGTVRLVDYTPGAADAVLEATHA